MSNSSVEDPAGPSPEVRVFHYRSVCCREGDPQDPSGGTKAPLGGERRQENIEAIRRTLETEFQAREKHAREEGIKEGQSAVRAEVAREIAAFRDASATSLIQFGADRENYFHRVEGQVVKLALAIARKILHREAQLDPLLLAGVVRVALEEVSSASMVRLYVHPDQVQTWQEFLDRQIDLRQKPDILADAGIVEGQCRIESSIGSADLSIESQLTEIERGFFDLLAQRPEIP
jgi:flagellar assembly protein FliH